MTSIVRSGICGHKARRHALPPHMPRGNHRCRTASKLDREAHAVDETAVGRRVNAVDWGLEHRFLDECPESVGVVETELEDRCPVSPVAGWREDPARPFSLFAPDVPGTRHQFSYPSWSQRVPIESRQTRVFAPLE
jgi:hypothetical protein